MQQPLTCVEICAGAGGQALGLAMAGFVHVALVEYEEDYCKVLKQNRPEWNVICADVHDFDGRPYHGVDLLAGGVPCPPFSVAGKQLGQEDERDLFPEAIRLIKEIQPRAVMLENVRGFLDSGFDEYRDHIFTSIQKLGYVTHIKLLNASDYGVPQLRPRVVIIGIRKDQIGAFAYPDEQPDNAPTVGDTLRDLMAQNGWEGAKQWASNANRIAPTLVGGSKKHGGPDLGPTRARPTPSSATEKSSATAYVRKSSRTRWHPPSGRPISTFSTGRASASGANWWTWRCRWTLCRKAAAGSPWVRSGSARARTA